mgnify:CR=1 FL=1
MTFDTILIPTDGSDPAEAAAQRGFDLAEQLKADVDILSVADSSVATGTGYSGDSASIRSRLHEQATTHATSLRTHAKECGLNVEAVVRNGIPAKEITDYAEESEPDLIVMGTAGRGGVARAIVGSVTDKVVRTATVPVLTLNQAALNNDSGSVDSILLPTDGSDTAEAAAAYAVGLADQVDATVHYVSVVDKQATNGLGSFVGESDSSSRADRFVEQAAARVEQLSTTATERGVECVTATATGDPAEEIVAYATDHDIDLIAMGTHGRGSFERLLVGSVTDNVVRAATVPVLTVRDD